MSESTAVSQVNKPAHRSRKSVPRVSIGMPVYNGENYLEQTLTSLLAQSLKDFELIISDNASTDKTEKICRSYALADSRIQYHRYEENQGAAWNFNNVVSLARCEFFMWAAHDDLWDPEYIERCAEVLCQHSEVVLCYTATQEINENGEIGIQTATNSQLGSPKPYVRFGASWRYSPHIPVFGLMRAEILKKTRLIGNYSSADRVIVGHLALFGPFYGIKDYLFFYRRHREQSTGGGRHALVGWYDPKKRGKISFPHWRLLREHLISVNRTPLSIVEQVACYASILRWMVRNRWYLLNNLLLREPSRKQRLEKPNTVR